MIAAVSSLTTGLIGVALLAVAVVVGLLVGPKWWHWGSFIVLTLVLFVPLMMAFFISAARRDRPERRDKPRRLGEKAPRGRERRLLVPS